MLHVVFLCEIKRWFTGLSYNSTTDGIEGFQDLGLHGTSKCIADHALVFLVRGLRVKWKQPFGYFLSAGTVPAAALKSMVRNSIGKLQSIGFKVRALICDQGPNNRSFLETLESVKTSKPYFEVKGERIFVVYDPPHLIKCVRNNFRNRGFISDGRHILWKYVGQLYEFDKDNSVRIAPRLSARHLNPGPFGLMRVNLAVQVMSHSVASGISTLCKLNEMPKDALYTAEFIEMFDKLFNAFNSGMRYSSQQYRHAVSITSGHVEFLHHCLNKLQKVTLSNGRSVPCLNGWQISIKNLLFLWNDLHINQQFQFLLTNRLNQDCIENLFSLVRGKGGYRDNPNPMQFRSAFRSIVVQLLLETSENSNCETDFDKILLELTSIVKENTNKGSYEVPAVTFNVNCSDAGSIFEVMKTNSSGVQNVCAYIGGYLLHKANIVCDECYDMLELPSIPLFDDLYVLLREKTYSTGGTLRCPTRDFVAFVVVLDNHFNSTFFKLANCGKIMYRLNHSAVNWMDDLLQLCCGQAECFRKLEYIVRLFLK